MHEYNSPSPGKTAPRLLEDLLDYDPRYARKRDYHLLADPAPQYTDPKKTIPLRKSERDCRHDLMLKPDQSSAFLSADQNPNFSTPSVVAAYCSHCRYHFLITVDHTKSGNGPREPCALGTSNPLHHFRYVQHKSHRGRVPENSKYDGHTELHHFKCSNLKCPAFTEIKITPPRFRNEFIKQFADPARLEARFKAAVRAYELIDRPDRFKDLHTLKASEALNVLFRYLQDALKPKSDQKKRIAKNNKTFLIAYAEDCDDMLRYLDFWESREADHDGEMQDFWNLPCLDGNVEKTNFLDDVTLELLQLIADRMSNEKPHIRFSYEPTSAMKPIQRSLGCWDYPRKSRQINLTATEHPHYASLGACQDFTDDFIIYSYFKQKRCDEPNKPYYLDCLVGIATGRESTDLQVEFAKEESSGELRYQTIAEAYKFFALEPSTTEGDDHIIGVYRSRIESAPRQKDEARNCLRVIGKSRKSSKLEAVADDKSMSIQEAYEFLGVNWETPADSIEAAAVAKERSFDGDPKQVVKALRVIANNRNDPALHTVATGMEPQDSNMLDIAQAYKTLQIPDTTISDLVVLAYYEHLMKEAMGQGSRESYEKALKTVALDRKSDFLLAKLDNPDAVVGTQSSTAEHPIGLQNIGNTCYLNSLLQFYYTVKPIRDIVMNFEDYRMAIDDGNVSKRVGGQVVGRGEIIKAQQFVEELGILYSNLKTASTADVRPSQRLAELALLSTEQENSFRRSSISSPPATFTSLKSPVPAANISAPFDFGIQPLPPPATLPSPSNSEPVDVEMTEGPPPYTPLEPDDTSSEATLVNSDQNQTPNINRDVDSPMRDISDDSKGKEIFEVVSPQRYSTPENAEIIDGVDPFADSAAEKDSRQTEQDLGLDVPMLDKPPPIPPRNKPEPINTATANDKSIGVEMLKFGSQQDVTEVIQNVLFRLSCAIKPLAIDPDNRNEQIDQIRNTFFGQSIISLQKPEGLVSRHDDWNNLVVFPAENGTRSIYEALDVYFDPQKVDYDNQKLPQYSYIKKLPPILQILIQRTAYDKKTNQASKNQNWITADETIYLDRYLETEPDSQLMARRREAGAWKERLRVLEARQRVLVGSSTSTVPEALSASADLLKTLQEDEIEGLDIDPSLIDGLEARSDETSRELRDINVEIAELRKRLDDQFTDMRKHKYTLQAVFMHRGTSTFGHYWIYIYDFVKHIWREYNDERVSVVEDTKKIFSPDTGTGNKATPYYLVYVDEQQKSQLVDAVCRDLRAPAIPNQSRVSLPSVAEIEDEGIDMSEKKGGGSSMHIEHA